MGSSNSQCWILEARLWFGHPSQIPGSFELDGLTLAPIKLNFEELQWDFRTTGWSAGQSVYDQEFIDGSSKELANEEKTEVLGDAHAAKKQELEQLTVCREEVAVEAA